MQLHRTANLFHKTLFGFSLLFCCFEVSAEQHYSNLVSFGDSLSDTGNLASATVNFPFPYSDNRVTNGPVALDYLATHLNTIALASELDGNNYSVAGGNIIGNQVEDLTSQVTSFLERLDGGADQDALYFVMMGGNDLRGLRSETSNEIAQLVIEQLVDTLVAQITRLHEAGAKQFFIANVANIGRIPETLQRETADPGVIARVTGYTQAFNRLLADELAIFRQQTASAVIEFDTFSKLNTILDSSQAYGFTNTTEGCFYPSDLSFHNDCIFGFRFDEFVFFDNLHPSAAIHQLMGEAMVERLNEGDSAQPKIVPLAAILFLLLMEEM